MEAWERVWGRLDEDWTNGEGSRKPHGQTVESHGRASDKPGRVGLCESKHGQPWLSHGRASEQSGRVIFAE
ncbi:unnamed protein product, partial [Linum tenue]